MSAPTILRCLQCDEPAMIGAKFCSRHHKVDKMMGGLDDSLLSKARRHRVLGKSQLIITDELIALTWAYLRNEITITQVAAALDMQNHAAYSRLANIAQHMVLQGLLVPSERFDGGS